ncbi:Osmotically-inducible protein OsmY, contains BON domain [Xaviernesmea oryzae]|uniref:Osmotically-inducible protein OsmY, contains BON domain n=1 Tax=Xaviernesmea oryzae TaxID=464029 RepID=A0A1X7D4D6_9HYPH|nr:BON domain-containing protein [Xaviernesmea oryzae]SMF08667.1 Osmotically-inducible protein OsmY, contains BON domain [Xaviernesmea oryzae]
MANGNYSQSGGYRNDRMRDERDFARETSGDYRPGDTGYVRGFGDYQRSGDNSFGDRESGGSEGDRSRSSRYGRGEQWASDDYGYESGYGDTERSRAWARESYRGRPSSFSYEPGRRRVNQAYGDRYGADYGYGSVSDRGYGREDRFRGSDDRGSQRSFMERAGDEVASWFGDEEAEQRRMMDQHRGKAPKGYQRSDSRIEEDVNDRLSDDPVLDASNITVTVKSAEVTLDGFVSSRWDKRRAEDLVDDVSGVRHVQNNLRVNSAPADTLTGSTTD